MTKMVTSEVPGTQIGASFFEFELKPTGKDSEDPTQHEFQQHILLARRNPSLNTGLEWSAYRKILAKNLQKNKLSWRPTLGDTS